MRLCGYVLQDAVESLCSNKNVSHPYVVYTEPASYLQQGRRLQEADLTSSSTTTPADAPVVTVVTTAAQLREAIKNGDAHIELQSHLDLISSASPYFGAVKPTLKTFRARSCCFFDTHAAVVFI